MVKTSKGVFEAKKVFFSEGKKQFSEQKKSKKLIFFSLKISKKRKS